MTDFIAKGGMIGTMVSAEGTIEMDQGQGNYQKQLQKEKFDQEANKLWLRMKNEVVQELREKASLEVDGSNTPYFKCQDPYSSLLSTLCAVDTPPSFRSHSAITRPHNPSQLHLFTSSC
ncbi:hypothetical protein CTI12_AA211350 [Artemisia annua]|uniref:Uncharacterized protein n=1 Tax=Artemisia annua TaxID=35608 RepID=A0A2U1NZ58_ARTAN|nr:hypothetical protein CTI12_AA211350 [Artemisia annua]